MTYEEIEGAAMRDMVEGPQKTLLKIWEAEKRYKSAFNKILAEKGAVTNEDLNNELKSMKQPRIYLSGPISGYDLEERRTTFRLVRKKLESMGYEVFNPMENGLPAEATTHQHMRRDLSELTREDRPYDAIFLMDRWNHSAGCMTELHVATAIGLQVYTEFRGDIVRIM